MVVVVAPCLVYVPVLLKALVPLKPCNSVLKPLASFQVPLLLIVPPVNTMALLFVAVLPLHVVVPLRFSARPAASDLLVAPVIARVLLNVNVPAPVIAPPVQVAAPLNVAPVPCRLPPLTSIVV